MDTNREAVVGHSWGYIRGIPEIPRSWDKKAVHGDRGQREQSGSGEYINTIPKNKGKLFVETSIYFRHYIHIHIKKQVSKNRYKI